MPQVRIHLFGAPRLLRDGEDQDLGTRKAWALLAYLVVSEQAFRRDTLATLFWPDAERGQGLANLRNLLWLLNKSMGEGWLVSEHGTVALPPREGYGWM